MIGVLSLLLHDPAISEDIEWSGSVGIEPRCFLQTPAYPNQPGKGCSLSGVFAPEWRNEWKDGNSRLTVAAFARYDQDDNARSHLDLREANWQIFSERWSMLVGIGKVFWGVAESRHLVDIINQTDFVEDIDEEEKLGQPLLRFERWSEAGTVGVYIMPGFRERTFPAKDARLRGPFPIADNDAIYESGSEEQHVDFALRWFRSTGNWDAGLSAFYGTGREPRLVPDSANGQQIVLVPHYDLISQFGVDLQLTTGSWLWKLESIARSGNGKSFGAAVGGLEYTLFGIGSSNADIGLLVEYLYDGRDNTAPPTVLEDDVFVGGRLTLNDPDDTNLLAGLIYDLGEEESFAFIEGQRRVGDHWVLEAELRWFQDTSNKSYLETYKNDSYLMIGATWFY